MITGQLEIYPLFSWVFNPNMNQNQLAHAALYLTNVAGHRTVYRFYPTWTENPKRRGLILASRELPGALQELDEITYPHFRLHHEKSLSARMQEQTDIVKSLLPVPEDVDLPPLEPPTFTVACYNPGASSCVGGSSNVATQPVGKNRMPAGSVLRFGLVPTMDDHESRVPGTCNALASERYHVAGG